MPSSDLKKEKASQEQELKIQQQIAFASGLFQGDVTFRTLLESFAEGVVIIDNSGIILLVNTSTEQMFGYPKKELIGTHFSCFYPEEERLAGKPEEELKKAAIEGRVVYELWRIRKDGSRFWADVITTALYDESGNLQGFSRVTHDITEHKKAEEALRISGDRYRAMFSNNLAMITILDADLTMLSANPFFTSLLGYTIEELEGQSILKIIYADDRPAVVAQLQRCLQNPDEVNRWRFRKIRKDGSLLWIEEIAQAVYDENGALNIMVVCQDVTERKQMEEALRESEAKFSAAFQATPNVFVIASLADGRYLEVNEAFERVLGYSRAEVIGRSSLELDIWQHPEDRTMVLRMLAEGKRVRDLEIGLRSKSGAIIVGLYAAEIIDIGAEKCLVSLVSDITARKKAEEALRRSEERYRRLYNETPVMLYSIDQDGRLVSVSNYWLETLGYERDEVLGRRTTEFLTAASRRYANEVVLPEFFRIGSVKEVSYQFVKKNGEILDVLLSAISEQDSEGKIIRSLAVMVDVTERKRAEEALRKSEDKFSQIFHSVPVLITISTLAEGRFIDVNETCLRTLGYQRKELLGFTSRELGIWGSEGDRERVIRELEERGSVRDLEVNLRSKSGESVSVLFSAELIDFENERYMLSLVSDISKRKRAEEALLRRTSELEAIFHAFPDVYFWVDAEERIIDFKAGNKADLYAAPELFLGKRMQDVLPPDVGKRLHAAIQQVLTTGALVALEYWLPVRDRNQAYEARLLPLRENQVFCVVRNITPRKEAEEEIVRLNTDLATRAAELEAANRELETFNYTVAHDLRKPLTVVNGYCQIIETICGDQLNEECKGYLRETYDGTLRMNRLIDALLKFSSMAQIEPSRETVDLSAVAQVVAAELAQAEPARQVEFRISEGISVIGDANLLRVVLDNLLGNAWKYTGMREEGIIEFGTTEVEGKPTYFVRDNGAGFDMATADKLFVPFQRLPGAEGEGHGIGLSTVERIVNRLGGRVWAEGEAGKGATFYFTLAAE